MEETDGSSHHTSLGEKLKHPFHELKEKLHNTHLHDAKVSLIHKK
jgi:phospholipase D1/2